MRELKHVFPPLPKNMPQLRIFKAGPLPSSATWAYQGAET